MKATLYVNPFDEKVISIPFAPDNLMEIERVLNRPHPHQYTLHNPNCPVAAVDPSGLDVSAGVNAVAGEQPVNPVNRVGSFSIGGDVIYGPASLVAHPTPENVVLPSSPLTPIGFLRFNDADALIPLISFQPKEVTEPEKPERYNIDQLDSYLRLICKAAETLDGGSCGLVMRFISQDQRGDQSAAMNFRHYQFHDMRRWCLDVFDSYQSVLFDWNLRQHADLGSHKETKSAFRLATVSGKGEKVDFSLTTVAGQYNFKLSTVLTPVEKGYKPVFYPIAGVTAWAEIYERCFLTSWQAEKAQ